MTIPAYPAGTGMMNTSSNPNYPNLLSASGMANSIPEVGNQEMSPADSAITQIGGLVQQFRAIADSFPGVAETARNNVEAAIMSYMQEVIGSLNSSPSAQMPANGAPTPY